MPEVDLVSLRALRRTLAPMLLTTLLTAGVGTVATVAAPTAAYADTASMESQFIAAMNSARQANGMQPYAVAGDLTAVARQHSQAMSSQHSLYHNPSLTTDVHDWRAVGENVGEGPSVEDIHHAFMNSPEHRANILDHDFTQVGVGVSVDGNGTIWVTEDFREPMSSTSAPTRPAAPAHHATTSTSSSPSSAASTSASTGTTASMVSAATPHSTPSPRAVLRARLHELRAHHAPRPAADPVAQAFTYVDTLSRLAG